MASPAMSTKGSKWGGLKVNSAISGGEGPINLRYSSQSVINETSSEPERLPFHVFLLLEKFLNVCFFILLVPFRIVKNSQGFYERRRNIFQQILSTLAIALVLLYCFLDLRLIVVYNLKQKPEEAFRRATFFIQHLMPICWAITFWLKAASFDDFLSVCQYSTHLQQMQSQFNAEDICITSKKPSWKLIWFLKITLFITFARFLNAQYYFHDGSVEVYLNFIISRALFNLYMIKGGKFVSIKNEERLSSTLLTTSSYALVPTDIQFGFIGMIFEQFCLIGAVMVYAACGDFSERFESWRVSLYTNSSASQTQKVIKGISKCYLDLVSTVESINKIFGPSVILFFMYLYPLLIWTVFNRNYDDSVSEILFKGFDVANLVLVVGIAAAANGKLGELKRWLFYMSMTDLFPNQPPMFERSSPGNASAMSVKEQDNPIISQDGKLEIRFALAAMHREMSSEVIGLKGCNLFTITYSFIVTMTGILITYAIVMLQFIMKPEENDTLKNCNICNIIKTCAADNFTNSVTKS
ncbi:unnamed protein product [Orchesella dallaii]|uniref:Gustatory receptor n=1 Tax=Orchesella dallaii TaxID=48710 RepID=A0ABP1S6Q1_9HEXA